MTRPPSQAVIEAVEQAESRHKYLTYGECSCGYLSLDYEGWRSHHRRFEVARAAEAAALKVAAERMDDLSRGTRARPHARSWLRARANKLTDTDDRSESDE